MLFYVNWSQIEISHMNKITVRVYKEKEQLAKEKQLAYIIAKIAACNNKLDDDCVEMVGNRIIDNASVALASINRQSVKVARFQALSHLREGGSSLFGLGPQTKVHAEWATWANNTAVRELDFHDTFLAADYSHPGDNIPAILAVAEQKNIDGKKLTLAILTAYEIQVNLVKSICLHQHKIDHVAHLAPATAAGIGTLLDLDTDIIYHGVNQAEHVSISTRQSRKGQISSWKAYAPGHACKLAVEAMDRAMRGEKSPSPIWEGEDSIISWILDGKSASYQVPMPEPGESCRSIMETYTKEHSAEYQAQALIDLAFSLSKKIDNLSQIKEIILHTSHHTHYVIGTGSGDPQKFDPNATRETLDHSIMYIFAVALEDRNWNHINSYTPERTHRESTIALWKKISTREDEAWTKKYHDPDPNCKSFGARAEVIMENGKKIIEEKTLANAHPAGDIPFDREQYKTKFLTLTEGIVSTKEQKNFFSFVERLPKLSPKEVIGLNPIVLSEKIENNTFNQNGIF